MFSFLSPLGIWKHLITTSSMAEAAQIQEARTKRSTAKSQFTRAEKSLNDALASDDVSASTIQRRFNELKIKWDNVQEAHDAYAALQEGRVA